MRALWVRKKSKRTENYAGALWRCPSPHRPGTKSSFPDTLRKLLMSSLDADAIAQTLSPGILRREKAEREAREAVVEQEATLERARREDEPIGKGKP